MANFDEIFNRKHTGCFKWDSLIAACGENDIIPMGIADMDFMCCDKIQKAIAKRAEHGVYGYSWDVEGQLSEAIYKRYSKRNYPISKEDIVIGTGVVYEISHIIRTFTKENDKIVLPTPYYTPFEQLINNNRRIILECPMAERNGHYELDLSVIENQIDDTVKMFIFCNPHNPTGRIFTHEELKEVADFCERHNLLIISDEIHADFALNRQFEPIINVSEYALMNTFTMLSCTKTFNLAGLKVAFGFICDKEKREIYRRACHHTGLESVNIFGIEACLCAYNKCEEWEKELVNYLRRNIDFAVEYFHTNLPEIKVYKPDGTYLLWLDFSQCHLDNPDKFFIEHARVQLNGGTHYGDYAGFARMNCALPYSQLEEACKRIKESLKHR